MKIHEFINDYCRNCGVHYNSVFNECIGASGISGNCGSGGIGYDGKLDGLGGGNFGVLAHAGGVISNCEEMVSVRKKDLEDLVEIFMRVSDWGNPDFKFDKLKSFIEKYLKNGG